VQVTTPSIRSIINPAIIKTKFITGGEGFCVPNKVNNKLPATMLAASWIAKVAGRITLITASMTSIIGIRNPGVPGGTKYTTTLFHWKIIESVISSSHNGNTNLKMIDKCLGGVKYNIQNL